MTNQQLGHYEITGKIGAGGMGEVYRARDTKLGREVALKLLPEIFAQDDDRLARFKREAKLLAALNHAHVATLHGLEEDRGQHFLVMELVEGEDLAERLRKGPIPVNEALRIVRDVADALQAAHARGIIHRDLKPANIRVTPDGKVKVLDFGLAKAFESDPDNPDITQSPTIATAMGTMGGVILGTAAYMSPEQARGKTVDKLTDVWALGAVLFELLSGNPAFPGETVSDTIAKILEREPDWKALPADTPPSIVRLLHRCLEKDKSMRLQDVGEVRVEAAGVLSGTSQAWTGPVATAVPPRKRSRGGLGWILGAIGVGAAVVFALLYAVSRPEPPRLVRSSIPQPPGSRFISMGDYGGPVVISPDGKTIAFCANNADLERMVWVRDLSALEAHVLPGTAGGMFPFWSPDSKSVGYFTDNRLMRVELAGGLPITVCAAANGRGGTWSESGVILFSPDFQAGLVKVPAEGGNPVPVTQLDTDKHSTHRWPEFMPDGDHFTVLAVHHDVSNAAEYGIYFGSLSGDGELKRVMRCNTNAVYGSDHLLYLRDATLMAVPFDAVAGEITGTPVAMVDKVQSDPTTWRAALSVSRDGVMAYHGAAGDGTPSTRMAIMDRDGNETDAIEDAQVYYHLQVSPDGRRIACSSGTPTAGTLGLDIYVYDIDRRVRSRLSFGDGADVCAVWSPDGSEIAYGTIFVGSATDPSIMTVARADGGGARVVLEDSLDLWPSDWSPDGKYILFSKGAFVGLASEVWAMSTDTWTAFPVIQSEFEDDVAALSPDGRWLAYATTTPTDNQIYVAPFLPPVEFGGDPNDGRAFSKWQLSSDADAGSFPVWHPSGKELFFIKADGSILVAQVDGSGDTFRTGRIELVCRTDPWNFGRIGYDIMPDGKHFVVNSFNTTATPPITLVQNWPLELTR
jgi:serine/threonine protein kinase/Tol biopolymer transport system component